MSKTTEVKHVVLVAATTGYQTRMFAEAARRVGARLTLATDRCHVLEDPWGDGAVAIRFEDVEQSAARIPAFDAILAVADKPTLIAARAAERAGVPYHPVAAVEACHSKFLTRERFRAAGMAVPRTHLLALEENVEPPIEFPCVLKPLALSASRGVIRANNAAEFQAAFQRIRSILAAEREPNTHLLVESFIPGYEYALEGLVTAGRLQPLAIFEKPDPLDGPFFEESIYVTVPVRQDIVTATQSAVTALGLSHGPIHAEMRLNNEGVHMLEVAARPIGGLCAKALRFTNGMPLEELILRHALGEDCSAITREAEPSGVMMIPIPQGGIYAGVAGLEDVEQEVIITAKAGQRISMLPEGASYLGFIFARGKNPAAELRAAHAKLRFSILPELPVI